MLLFFVIFACPPLSGALAAAKKKLHCHQTADKNQELKLNTKSLSLKLIQRQHVLKNERKLKQKKTKTHHKKQMVAGKFLLGAMQKTEQEAVGNYLMNESKVKQLVYIKGFSPTP